MTTKKQSDLAQRLGSLAPSDPYRPTPTPTPELLVFRDDEERSFWMSCVVAWISSEKNFLVPPTPASLPFTPLYPSCTPLPPTPTPYNAATALIACEQADALVLARRYREKLR